MELFGFHIGRQKRQDQLVESDYDDPDRSAAIVEAAQTAAVIFGRNLVARGFAAASLEPDIMTPDELAGVGIDMIMQGQFVGLIGVRGFGPAVYRASSAVIRGDYRRTSWRYDLTLPAPSEQAPPAYGIPYNGVVHVMMQTERSAPWRGRSPVQDAYVTTDLLASIEEGLMEEEEITRLYLLSHGPDAGGARKDFLREDLSKGGLRLMQNGATSYPGQASRTANNEVGGRRIGPEPNANEIALRAQVSQDVLSAMGIPSGLYAAREGSVSREAYRQWHASTLEPMGEVLRYELDKKLGRPVRINFNKLAAADINARARGFGSLVGAGVTPESALSAVGMSGLRFVPPAPPPVQNDAPPQTDA